MIEIDVISGFLGAGKTTFANMLLKRYLSENERPVYIVNEFGQTGVDAELIRSEGFEAVSLAGGCICCTLKGELTLALKEIIRAFEPTKIVFETSGIFVFNQFEEILKDEYLHDRCRIRRTIVVVDSVNYKYTGIIAGSFIENQIKNASVIALSKLERFQGDISEIVCDLGNVNTDAVLLAQSWHERGFLDNVLAAETKGVSCAFGHSHAHLEAVTIRAERNFGNMTYEKLIQCIISGDCGSIMRVKGFIRINGMNHILNIAMQDVILKKATIFGEVRLTIIGEHLNKDRLEQLLTNG